jgi:hypothetical protein
MLLTWTIGDCCADAPAAVHAHLLADVLPRQATVVTADETVASLGAG